MADKTLENAWQTLTDKTPERKAAFEKWFASAKDYAERRAIWARGNSEEKAAVASKLV